MSLAVADPLPDSPAPVAARPRSTEAALDVAGPAVTPPQALAAAAPVEGPPATAGISWGVWLMGIWALGSLLLFARLAWANLVTFRALRTRAGTTPPWLATAHRLARRSGVPRTHFVRAEAITMPMAAGYLRPTVALPAEADAWPAERVTSVLLHELAHIRRRDCLTQLAASTACALYWMNPLAWHAARSLRRERERACDDAVLVAGTAGPTYAEHLLDVARAARHVTTPTWSGGVAMAHRSELEGRLMAILDDARNRQSVSYGAAGLAGLLCLALVTPLAALDPWALSAAEAQPTGVAIPPGAGPERPAPKTPRPSRRAPRGGSGARRGCASRGPEPSSRRPRRWHQPRRWRRSRRSTSTSPWRQRPSCRRLHWSTPSRPWRRRRPSRPSRRAPRAPWTWRSR